jgi:hypothetical protein
MGFLDASKTSIEQEYVDGLKAYLLKNGPVWDNSQASGFSVQGMVSGTGPDTQNAYDQNYDKLVADTEAAYRATIPPAKLAQIDADIHARGDKNAATSKIAGSVILAAVGGAGALANAGLLGSAAAPGATGAASGGSGGLLSTTGASVFNPAVDSQLFNAAAGITGADAAAAATVPSAVNLVNAGGLMSTAAEALPAAQTVFNAAKDSQLFNEAAGITGDMAAKAALVPAAVDLVNGGGLMSTGIDYATQLPLSQLNAPPVTPNSPPAASPPTTPPPGTPTPNASSGALDALKAAGLIGGAYLGSQTQPGETITQQSKTDPRVDPYIYGDQGVLKSAQDWFLANKSGVNPTMQQGWDTRLGLLTNPATMSGLQGLQKNAMGLLSNPIASNPWIKG